MRKNIFFALCILLIWPFCTMGQKSYKTPKHSLGIEVNQSISMMGAFTSAQGPSKSYLHGYGASFIAPYQYAPKSSFFGLQSGLGFFMWGTRYRRGFHYETESLYCLGIPMAAQLKVSKSFWIELGLQANFAVYNSLVEASEWNSSSPYIQEPPGRLPFVELQSILGFRYHIFRSLAFSLRLHYGLTPAYHLEYPAFDDPYYFQQEERHYRYRLAVFEMGMSYLFPLKK